MLGEKSMKTSRYSGIELYKIIGILCVITSHIIYNDYLIDLNQATSNVQYLICAILRYSGAIGDTIFFVASA